MKNNNAINIWSIVRYSILTLLALVMFIATQAYAQVKLEAEIPITKSALFFGGKAVPFTFKNNQGEPYNYRYGPQISAHGDAIKKHKNFIFTSWYKGGEKNRNVMLSRYNLNTGTIKTIQFPHKHVGFRGKWWIGESHNTIAVGISPKDGTIHLLYDMHSFKDHGATKNDYFRYAYSVKNAANVADKDFKLSLFVQDRKNDYNHVGLNGKEDVKQFESLTYPRFYLNADGDLYMHMRKGGNKNGAYVFSRYVASSSKWDTLTQLNVLDASKRGMSYDWGLYGSVKYVSGKLRVAYQMRSANTADRYRHQNGVYYAYSDDQSGRGQWKDHTGKGFKIPYLNPEIIKIVEPGDYVKSQKRNAINIVRGFDWTVTDRGDVHIISRVIDEENKQTINLHTYKPRGQDDFITTTSFTGAEQLYTYANNLYLIGLKNGRPFVQRGQGGKNNFVTVYESNQGKRFRHGVPYISDGKLYYYMQELVPSSSSVPLYVQVIDLDLPKANKATAQIKPREQNTASSSAPKLVQSESSAPKSSEQFDHCLKYSGGPLMELDLSESLCVDSTVGLFGKTLIIRDSENKECNYRGLVKTVNGRGTLNVNENFEAKTGLTGKTLLFVPSNTCRAVRLRIR